MTARATRPWAVFLLAGALGALAAGVSAQSVPDNDPSPAVPGLVMSDVQPLPAEDRQSMGAVVLDQSRVRAQQPVRNAFDASAQRTGIPSAIGRNVSRVVDQARSWNELREADASFVPRD